MTQLKPFFYRKNIPFYYPKSETEFRADKYEYQESVHRQLRLHFADQMHGRYPFQPILDQLFEHINGIYPLSILEIGCGVGRMIGEIAAKFPSSDCFGIDYSYQLLKRGNDFLVEGKALELDGRNQGFSQLNLEGKQLSKLQFALAKAEQLPFEDASFDFVFSSFVLDRLDNPKQALEEQFRVLKKGGKCLIVSPMNFQKQEHWDLFFPIEKLEKICRELGFRLEPSPQEMVVKEPLDLKGNAVLWQCFVIGLLKD